jgi:hypothetical protein
MPRPASGGRATDLLVWGRSVRGRVDQRSRAHVSGDPPVPRLNELNRVLAVPQVRIEGSRQRRSREVLEWHEQLDRGCARIGWSVSAMGHGSQKVRLISWNVNGSYGRVPARQIAVVREQGLDVVALQELRAKSLPVCERCSQESISLYVVLRCQAQAVAHHPRLEARRLASASPESLRWRGSVDVTGGTSRHLGTPKRLARGAPSPAPTVETGGRAATHLSTFSDDGAASGPRFRSHAGRPLRPFGEARRRESAVVCQQPPVVRSTQFGGRRRTRPRSRRDCRNL